MANDRNDFAPEVRNSAWWSGDTRMAVNGKANEAILQKLGLLEREDLSNVEAVQMGHVMQPVIGRLVTSKLGLEIKDADYALAHPTERWLKSHFDFITTDGQTLVEAKNYNGAYRNKFDPDTNLVPAADLAQCIHEAAVHGVNRVILAVLFGGQEFCTFDFNISEEQKTELIQEMAKFWAAVETKTPLPPETTAQTKILFPKDTGQSVLANSAIEKAAQQLKVVSQQIKTLEAQEDMLKTALQSYMQSGSELISVDGTVLATWRNSKASKRFDAKLFQSSMPDIYDKFVVEAPGSRRFLVK